VQAAIDTLPAGSTIRVCAGTYAPITIRKNLTLIGEGDGVNSGSNTILDAGGTGRVVDVGSGVTASLQGLRVTGGFTTLGGAGVYNQGTLTMTDCTVIGNSTPDIVQGGGIFNGWNLTMTTCTISQNFAENFGGGIATSGNLALVGCTLSGNTSGKGGNAIWCAGGTTTLTGCTVGPSNSVGWYGTIHVLLNTTVTLNDTSVRGNIAVEGGGIYNDGGSVTLENGSTVSGNRAIGSGGGGGIKNGGGSVTLKGGSVVSGNDPNNCVGTITGPGCAL
jgi:predicted outer membrane repeat protein